MGLNLTKANTINGTAPKHQLHNIYRIIPRGISNIYSILEIKQGYEYSQYALADDSHSHISYELKLCMYIYFLQLQSV